MKQEATQHTQKKVVWSEHADPSRPRGRDGVRQPIVGDGIGAPPAVQPADEALLFAVRERLAGEGRLADGEIDVAVRNGIAELTGAVALEFQRTLAQTVVGSVPGVLVVDNRLKVRE